MPKACRSRTVGVSQGSPRNRPTVAKPNRAPAAATACRWLEWAPPRVMTPALPARAASSRCGLSLYHLLPDSSASIRSRRSTGSSTPASASQSRRSVCSGGVGDQSGTVSMGGSAGNETAQPRALRDRCPARSGLPRRVWTAGLVSGAAVALAGHEAAGRLDAIQRNGAALAAGQAGGAGRLPVVLQPGAVMLRGHQAAGGHIGFGVALIAGHLARWNGQMAGARVVGHEHHAQLGEVLHGTLGALAQALDLVLHLRIQLVAPRQLGPQTGDVLLVRGANRLEALLNLLLQLVAQQLAGQLSVLPDRAQLAGEGLAGLAQLLGLPPHLRLQHVVLAPLLPQILLQRFQLGLQLALALLRVQAQAGELLLVLLGQAVQAQALLAEQLGGTLA